MVYFCICIFCILHTVIHCIYGGRKVSTARLISLNVNMCIMASVKKEKPAQAFGRLELSGSKATGELVGNPVFERRSDRLHNEAHQQVLFFLLSLPNTKPVFIKKMFYRVGPSLTQTQCADYIRSSSSFCCKPVEHK